MPGTGVKTRAADPAAPYVDGVLAGTVVAGPLVRRAVERHQRDRADGPARGLVWRPDLAMRPIRFIESVLRLPDSGTPFRLFPWETFVIGSLFG